MMISQKIKVISFVLSLCVFSMSVFNSTAIAQEANTFLKNRPLTRVVPEINSLIEKYGISEMQVQELHKQFFDEDETGLTNRFKHLMENQASDYVVEEEVDFNVVVKDGRFEVSPRVNIKTSLIGTSQRVISVSSNGSFIAVMNTESLTVHIGNVKTGQHLGSFKAAGIVFDALISDDGSTFVYCSYANERIRFLQYECHEKKKWEMRYRFSESSELDFISGGIISQNYVYALKGNTIKVVDLKQKTYSEMMPGKGESFDEGLSIAAYKDDFHNMIMMGRDENASYYMINKDTAIVSLKKLPFKAACFSNSGMIFGLKKEGFTFGVMADKAVTELCDLSDYIDKSSKSFFVDVSSDLSAGFVFDRDAQKVILIDIINGKVIEVIEGVLLVSKGFVGSGNNFYVQTTANEGRELLRCSFSTKQTTEFGEDVIPMIEFTSTLYSTAIDLLNDDINSSENVAAFRDAITDVASIALIKKKSNLPLVYAVWSHFARRMTAIFKNTSDYTNTKYNKLIELVSKLDAYKGNQNGFSAIFVIGGLFLVSLVSSLGFMYLGNNYFSLNDITTDSFLLGTLSILSAMCFGVYFVVGIVVLKICEIRKAVKERQIKEKEYLLNRKSIEKAVVENSLKDLNKYLTHKDHRLRDYCESALKEKGQISPKLAALKKTADILDVIRENGGKELTQGDMGFFKENKQFSVFLELVKKNWDKFNADQKNVLLRLSRDAAISDCIGFWARASYGEGGEIYYHIYHEAIETLNVVELKRFQEYLAVDYQKEFQQELLTGFKNLSDEDQTAFVSDAFKAGVLDLLPEEEVILNNNAVSSILRSYENAVRKKEAIEWLLKVAKNDPAIYDSLFKRGDALDDVYTAKGVLNPDGLSKRMMAVIKDKNSNYKSKLLAFFHLYEVASKPRDKALLIKVFLAFIKVGSHQELVSLSEIWKKVNDDDKRKIFDNVGADVIYHLIKNASFHSIAIQKYLGDYSERLNRRLTYDEVVFLRLLQNGIMKCQMDSPSMNRSLKMFSQTVDELLEYKNPEVTDNHLFNHFAKQMTADEKAIANDNQTKVNEILASLCNADIDVTDYKVRSSNRMGRVGENKHGEKTVSKIVFLNTLAATGVVMHEIMHDYVDKDLSGAEKELAVSIAECMLYESAALRLDRIDGRKPGESLRNMVRFYYRKDILAAANRKDLFFILRALSAESSMSAKSLAERLKDSFAYIYDDQSIELGKVISAADELIKRVFKPKMIAEGLKEHREAKYQALAADAVDELVSINRDALLFEGNPDEADFESLKGRETRFPAIYAFNEGDLYKLGFNAKGEFKFEKYESFPSLELAANHLKKYKHVHVVSDDEEQLLECYDEKTSLYSYRDAGKYLTAKGYTDLGDLRTVAVFAIGMVESGESEGEGIYEAHARINELNIRAINLMSLEGPLEAMSSFLSEVNKTISGLSTNREIESAA